MSPQMLLSFMLLGLVLFGSWSCYDKTRKTLCHYQGKDRKVQEFWTLLKSGQIIFDNKKFEINPDTVSSKWFRNGIHILFPVKVDYYHFVWWNTLPLDPNTYKPSWDTPELRAMLNTSEQTKSFFKNFTPPKTAKVSGLMQYMPLISFVLLVFIGFYLYSQQEGMKQVINMMQNQLNTLTPR